MRFCCSDGKQCIVFIVHRPSQTIKTTDSVKKLTGHGLLSPVIVLYTTRKTNDFENSFGQLLYTVSGKLNLNVKANSMQCTTKDQHTFFFLMDKLESWMINPKYLLLISYDINSYTYLIYRWFNENYKYVVSNQKMLIVLMSVLLYTLSLVPVRSWFVRMSHMPKKTSSREWVWWAPVCTVHQVPQRHSHKQAQTDMHTYRAERTSMSRVKWAQARCCAWLGNCSRYRRGRFVGLDRLGRH